MSLEAGKDGEELCWLQGGDNNGVGWMCRGGRVKEEVEEVE